MLDMTTASLECVLAEQNNGFKDDCVVMYVYATLHGRKRLQV